MTQVNFRKEVIKGILQNYAPTFESEHWGMLCSTPKQKGLVAKYEKDLEKEGGLIDNLDNSRQQNDSMLMSRFRSTKFALINC